MLCFRWEGAAQQGTAWLGQALDPVRIDKLGKFTFVLVKVENRQGSSKLLVRGRQGWSQAALVQDVESEVGSLHNYLMCHEHDKSVQQSV